MKTILKSFLLVMLLVVSSCNAPQNTAATGDEGNASSTSGGSSGGAAIQTLTAPQIRVKNYNQYNMTLEKLTGQSRSKYYDLFEALKGSLPADNEIEGLTPFNLIAMTRLADAYCKDYVEQESVVGKSLYSDLTPNLIELDIRDTLFAKFLDAKPTDTTFDSLRDEVENVLNNSDGQGGTLLPGAANNFTGYKSLTVAACVTILASPYITLLE